MHILWLDLNCSYVHSSLALPALHAQVKHRTDVNWEVVRATTNEQIDVVTNAIYEHRPDVVAASAWLFTHEYLLHIIARVKALLPQTTVILGGPEFLGNNETYLRHHTEIDCVLRGEGEESFARWLDVWHSPSAWSDIPGLCYIERNEYEHNDLKGPEEISPTPYHDNGLARVADFASLHAPEESTFFAWDKPFVQLETTRGCFNSCAFCVSGIGDPIRTLPLDVIRSRLDRIREHGIRDVRILDRTFNYNSQRAIALIQLFTEYHPYLRFHLEIHPALLTAPLRDILVTLPIGLLHMEAGIQSLRQDVLDSCLRKGALSSALDGLSFLCSQENLVTHADLIAGLPLYSLAHIYEDIHTLAEYKADEIQLELLKLLPGTIMRDEAEQRSIRYSPMPPYEVLEADSISSIELQEARRLSRLLDAYYNTTAWQQITRQLILEEAGFLNKFLHYLTAHNYIDQPMSLERRGELLYIFCKEHYPAYTTVVAIAWIEAGMSLKKRPAERVHTRQILPPNEWIILYGEYTENLRLCFLPTDDNGHGYWFGHDTTKQQPKPTFKAKG